MKAICEYCGNTYEAIHKGFIKRGTAKPVTKYCSRDCYNKATAPKPVNCAFCGKPFFGKWRGKNPDGTTKKSTYCSKECQNKANAKPFYTCQYCGKQFQSANSHPKKFCSYDCAHGESRERMAKKQAERDAILSSKVCKFCGESFTTTQMMAEYCSADCKRLAFNKAKRDKYEPKPRDYKKKNCEFCGAPYETTNPTQKFCSRKCAKAYRYKGLKPNYQRKAASILLKRDGCKCKLCGNDIDKEAKGLFALSIDHIKPQSKGGTDEIENLRLVHLICNSIRGNDENKNSISEEELKKYTESATG